MSEVLVLEFGSASTQKFSLIPATSANTPSMWYFSRDVAVNNPILPNIETMTAMSELDSDHGNLRQFRSVDDLMAYLHEDD
jgi:hypothetical protein